MNLYTIDVDISVFEQMISDGRHVSEMMCAMYNL